LVPFEYANHKKDTSKRLQTLRTKRRHDSEWVC